MVVDGLVGKKKVNTNPGWASLPDSFINNPVNPGAAIQGYLQDAQYTGARLRFPSNVVYTLEQPISVTNLKPAEVDFNGCTFKIPDSTAETALSLAGIVSRVLRNLIIDGNKNNNSGQDDYGLHIQDCRETDIYNFTIKNVTHHGIWVQSGVYGVRFHDTTIQDTYGFVSAAEIYVENGATDNVEFWRTTVSRDQYISNQALYLHGAGSMLVDGVTANGIPGYVVDVRSGNATVRNVTADWCGGLLISQAGTSEINIIADTLVGTNMVGRNGVSSIIDLRIAKTAVIGHVTATCLGSYNYYGVKVQMDGAAASLAGIDISNVNISGFRTSGILLSKLDTSTHFDTIALTPYDANSEIVTCNADVTANQYINALTAGTPNAGNTDPGGKLVIT